MNKATLVGVWPSDPNEEPVRRDRVLDTMGRDVTAIVANHTLGGMPDEAFTLLMDYLSKYDAMLRGEV